MSHLLAKGSRIALRERTLLEEGVRSKRCGENLEFHM